MLSVATMPSKTFGNMVAMNIIRPSMIAKHMNMLITKYIKRVNIG